MSDLVVRNGIVARRPEWMNPEYWETFVAPRIGKFYDKTFKTMFGWEYDIHYKGEIKRELTHEEMFGSATDGDCAGGGCKI